MTMENNSLKKEFKKIKQNIFPRPDWVDLSREILLQQISAQKEDQAKISFFDFSNLFIQFFRQRLLEPAVVMILVLATFLGSTLVINAAFYSLPGESLYPVKIALEKAHVALISDTQKKVELKMEFAEKRINEFDKIVQQTENNPAEKTKKIQQVVQELRNNVIEVNNHLTQLSQSFKQTDKQTDSAEVIKDKEQKVQMALDISSKTEELAKSIGEKVAGLSEAEQLEVEQIVSETVQSAQKASLSAQQLAEEVQSTGAATAPADGEIQGASNTEEEKTGLTNSDNNDTKPVENKVTEEKTDQTPNQ